MKSFKRILSLALIAGLGITLASCSNEKRNTVVPYEGIDLSTTIATSEKDITLTNKELYNRFRAKGYDLFLEELKKDLYKDEITALTNLVNSSSFTDLSDSDKKTLAYNNDNETNSINEERYNELKELYCDSISSSIANNIFGSSDKYTIDSLSDEEKDQKINKYIDTLARTGYTLSKDNIEYTDANNDGTVEINLSKIPADILATFIFTKAEQLYAQKAVYKTADEEYLYVGTEDEVKNSNYLFYEDNLASTYESTYKTFGTYKAIIITFNSRREAMKAMENLGTDITSANVLESYLELYNSYYYPYGVQNAADVETSDLFNFTVSLKENQLDDISNSVNTLITETLEDGDFLTEPRNLDNKYVLAYRISTSYDYNEKEYSELDADTKAAIDTKIKNNLIDANGSSYINTVLNKAIENSDIEIYDPLFETKFRNSYTDYYELINDKNPNIGKNLIAKFNGKEYTVEQFYNAALSKYGASIITEYFQQEYALKYLDDFVTEETQESNKKTLDDAIKDFKKGNNQTYTKDAGLETYLLGAYGYADKDSVLKYYYNANSCLSSYKSKVLFDEWATENHEISDSAKLVLNRILEVGNANYSELFTINLDHILINIDYNADGSPDDPDKFISEHPNMKNEFEQEVSNLMKALYQEAIYSDYKDNSLYKTLKYISNEFNKGSALRSNPSECWDDYKTKFNFLLTVEQLSSNEDITQDNVTNFVTPFADYVKDVYKKAISDNLEDDIDDNGNFILPTDGLLETASDASKISTSTLCKTIYGYHLLIINSYDTPDKLSFTKEANDENGYQSAIQVLLYEDEDDSNNNIYVTLDSYNDSDDEASINQLFIYYVQTKMGVESSLSSSISTLLDALFTDAISVYSSSNFQTMVLLDQINITSSNEKVANLIKNERNYYANLVIDYDQDSDYIEWISTDMDWSRPNEK